MRMPTRFVVGLGMLVTGVCVVTLWADPPQPEEYQALGTFKVDGWSGQVFWQFPRDDGTDYRVDLVVSKDLNSPLLRADRFDVWLLATGSRTATLKSAPRKGPLLETYLRGATASGQWFLGRELPRADLVAVAILVDGEPHIFRIPAAPQPAAGEK